MLAAVPWGLGWLIFGAREFLATDVMLAGIVMIAVIGLALEKLVFQRLEEWHKKRYLVLPGITGLWQVSGRSELDFDDLVHLDFIYLERWSLALDLTILLKTIPAVLSQRGAY